MRHREPIHAYRLVFPDGDHGPEFLWEWEQPYIDRLLWNAKTFGRRVVQLRIPRISATQSTGMLPRNPWECCHLVHGMTATLGA